MNRRIIHNLANSKTMIKDRLLVSSSKTRRYPRHTINRNVETLSTTSLKHWPKPMIESNGDYRDETHIEKYIGGPLYTAQPNLPRLPIPSIAQTIAKFLPTALPLAKTAEESQSLEKACANFPDQASVLHRRLEERREEMKDSSWLQLWWNTEGYLKVRDPVVVNVSYFFHFSDDGTVPPTLPRLARSHDDVEEEWSMGVKRGAAILAATAEYRKLVCSGTLPHDAIGRKEPKTPLCSTAFKYMFNSCRIPRRGQDTYRMYDPSLHKHCVVACRGQFFAVDFMDANGDSLPINVIEDRLQHCVVEAGRQGEGSGTINLGWLTSNDRDSWADSRAELLRVGGKKMEAALEMLESGAIMLCLDDEEPVSREQCAKIFWTGGLSSGDNRWFDKSVQIMCTKNGKAGLIGEHSMMDGMPMIGYANHITKRKYGDFKKTTMKHAPSSFSQTHDHVQNIFQNCTSDIITRDSKIGTMVDEAKIAFTKLVGDHSLDVQSFQGYGSNYIKKMGYSPDAYVQMAMQLAIYRLFKEQAGTYEATQMRPFLHGRTETTRTVSPASEAFIKRMGLRARYDENDSVVREEKLSLLRAATDSHVKYLASAGKGSGVDRHFFGLSMMLNNGEKSPDLFNNPLFIRSKTWRVSTSHLTHPNFDNWGYGEVVEDGVGLSYAVKSESCIFNITALKKHGWTEKLSHLLEEALVEMQLLNDMNQLKSKL